jgi:hypothetical protein
MSDTYGYIRGYVSRALIAAALSLGQLLGYDKAEDGGAAECWS